MGKGSKRRPMKIKREEFNENWDRIFGNKKSFDKDKRIYRSYKS